MIDLDARYAAIFSALRDGPLTPTQIRMATRLSRHQIGRAVAHHVDTHEPGLTELVTYDPARRVYFLPRDVLEFAKAQIPRLKGAITRCDRTLTVLDMHDAISGAPDPFSRRTRSTIMAHREETLTILETLRRVVQQEEDDR